MPTFPDPRVRPVLSVPEAGAFLGLSRSAAYDAARRGDIPTLRMGRSVRVPTAEFARQLRLAPDRPAPTR